MIRAFPSSIAASLAVVALMGSAALAQEGPMLKVAQSDQHGAYVTDAEGRALYLFEADTQGEGNAAAESACRNACAEAWPPLLAEAAPQAGEGADAGLIATFDRGDGQMQVTYNGWPLYYYVQDQAPGETKGHDIEDFGAEWYLVTPEGEKADDH